MLNINQNFDLKAPVFNFDRDYFNSVEELNAYDTSNVPNHFVTNVAGMLYLFTDGKWFPMIGTDYDDALHHVDLGCINARLEIDTQNSVPSRLWLSNISGCYSTLSPTSLNITNVDPIGGVSIEADYDGTSAGITVSGDNPSNTIVTNSLIICGDDSFKVDIYGDEGRMKINDVQGRFTNYSASGFSVQTKDNTKSIKLDINDTEAADEYGSTVNVNLTDDNSGYIANINVVDGFRHTDSSGSFSNLYSDGLYISDGINSAYIHSNTIEIDHGNGGFVEIDIFDNKYNLILLGSDYKFKISRPIDNTEGATITGVKSLTAFSNPSATKVWATDGSTVDLTTYTNYFNGTTTADKLKSKAVEVTDDTNSVTVSPTGITATNGSTTSNGSVKMSTDGEIIDNEYYTCGPVDMCLTSNEGFSARINAHAGFIHTNEDRMVAVLNGNGLYTYFPYKDTRNWETDLTPAAITMYFNGGTAMQISTGNGEEIYMALGSDEETRFKISRPLDNSEGATITGVKSIKAFSDPSNTKVFATDGSIADLSTKANASDLATKANTSDVLLKKSASGGYYIEANSNTLGEKAFAANDTCTASGLYSFSIGNNTRASGLLSYALGYCSYAQGNSSHSEGDYTWARAFASHAEGCVTRSYGFASHALGSYNVIDINAIHSVGIGNNTTRKNAEYIYAKNTENGGSLVDDPKNGYKYLIGVGGYDGISTDNTTYKSVQEVIADLTARIEQLEKLTANCVSISNVDEQTN